MSADETVYYAVRGTDKKAMSGGVAQDSMKRWSASSRRARAMDMAMAVQMIIVMGREWVCWGIKLCEKAVVGSCGGGDGRGLVSK
jgi:hypothetical protein